MKNKLEKLNRMYEDREKWLQECKLKKVDVQLFIDYCKKINPELGDKWDYTVANMHLAYKLTHGALSNQKHKSIK